jgi:hypothetical protein
VLGLQPHDEEQRHESFVYRPTQVFREYVVVQAERQLCSPESLVGTRPGRVGPDERDERGSNEDHGTTGLRAQEVSNRAGAPPATPLPRWVVMLSSWVLPSFLARGAMVREGYSTKEV